MTETVYIKLISVLTAIVAILLQRQHPLPPSHAMAFGAGITQSVMPQQIIGRPLYDTPSGALDIGYYYVGAAGPVAHLAAKPLVVPIVGSTTIMLQPEGLFPGSIGVEAHIIGTRFIGLDKDGNVVGMSDNQNIATQLTTKGAAFPSLIPTTSPAVLGL